MYSTHSKIRAKKLTIGGSPRMIIPGRGVAHADPRRNAKVWVCFRVRIAARLLGHCSIVFQTMELKGKGPGEKPHSGELLFGEAV